MPSEAMRELATTWLYNADHPNECASQEEVDNLATLLDQVRNEALRDAAHVCKARAMALHPTDDDEGHARGLEALYLEERIRALVSV